MATMKWPASCKIITQGYGVKNSRYVKGYHTGLDIGCMTGSPIYAAHDGTVTTASYQGAYGNQVAISAGGGLVSTYNHMSQIRATVGQNVSAGTVIGYVGSTGSSTGPHLHFEIRINGKDVDPTPYLDGSSVVPASTDATPASSVFDFPGQVLKFFTTLADPITWERVGMVLLGGILLLIAFVGMAKAKALGKGATGAITGAVKKVGSNG